VTTTGRFAVGIIAPNQARGWTLKQISPGILAWTTSAGRHYVV